MDISSIVLAKTKSGQNEIHARRFELDRRSRNLLLLIDGKTPARNLLAQFSRCGFSMSHLQGLIHLGLIEVHVDIEFSEEKSINKVVNADTEVVKTNPDRVVEINCFLNKTAKDLMGFFAALTFQQKVSLVADFKDYDKLREPLLDAVCKCKGPVVAKSIGDEFERLLKLT